MASAASFLLLAELKPMRCSNAKSKSQVSYHGERKSMAAGPQPNG